MSGEKIETGKRPIIGGNAAPEKLSRLESMTLLMKENLLRSLTIACAAILAAAAFLCDSPGDILEGMGKILTSRSVLITDYFVVGGMGASFLNASLVLTLGIILVLVEKIPFSGPTMAALFMNAGYGLWGKNPMTVIPIVFGIQIYCRLHHIKMSRHIYTALYGTCLAPFVTEIYFLLHLPVWVRFLAAVLLGIVIGFLLPPLSMHTASMHMGYNLFNVGFSAGILAFVAMCVMNSLGIMSETVLLWQTGRPVGIVVGLYLLFVIVFLIGFFTGGRKWDGLKKIFSRPGRAVTDFVLMDGASPTMMNMGLVGIICTSYILLIGGDFSGPVVGAILMAFGFSAFGAHVKNYLPVLLGVYLFTFVSQYDPTTPGIQLAAIFGVGLSPIAGQFGIAAGILAGILHSAVAMCTARFYGGLNLYNNGFSAGWVAIVMIPMLESFINNYKDRKKEHQKKEK
ncbi:MAG: DUF1576 domain-containing protein [Lachnospiraceae bacterium]|nr:DUF1576 domain-containing protein [Muribaculaceae bacterium]MCM1409955.1 DUF1576 domain-containing protein [Lachnospiraceae bacterium]